MSFTFLNLHLTTLQIFFKQMNKKNQNIDLWLIYMEMVVEAKKIGKWIWTQYNELDHWNKMQL